jgi:hypothetical protein
MLPTPPSSPFPSPSKPVAIPIASATAVSTKLPSRSVKGAQALSQPISTPAVNATSTTNTRSAPEVTTTNHPPRTLAELKSDLHIDGRQCGALTRRDTRCKHSVKDNEALIDAQLASMTGLTRASPDFESAMLELFMLVHCSQHDAGRSKECRLEAWSLTFPPGSADGSLFEVERHVRKALEPFSVDCIAHDNGWACKERIGGWKVQNCKKTLQELIKQEIYSDDAKLEFLLKVLEWNAHCNSHQSSTRFTRVAAWKESIMAVRPLPMPVSNRGLTSNVANDPESSPRAQTDSLSAQTLSITEKSAFPIMQVLPSPDSDPALYWPKAFDSSPFHILAQANHNSIPTSSHELIRDVIRKPLDADDLPGGCVYAYEVDGNKGYIKIGFTTRSVTKRHEEWSFHCNRQTKPLYPPLAQGGATILIEKEAAATPAVRVPHARRVEALCHAELDHRRIRIYCTACMKQHIEWFDVSAMEATTVIQKWSRWMSTQPYELRGLRFNSKRTLKISELERTSTFDLFMRDIAEAVTSL